MTSNPEFTLFFLHCYKMWKFRIGETLSWKTKVTKVQKHFTMNSNLLISKKTKPVTVSFQSIEMPKKVFRGFDNIFHVYLMRGFQKYARNWILMVAFKGQTKAGAKICCQMGWIGCAILKVAQKAIVRIQFLSYFWNPLIK